MNTPSPVAPVLTPGTLTHPKEQTYFIFVVIVSVLVWLILTVTIFGLIYAAIFAVFLWLGNGLMVASLRSEAVKVDERQMPELDLAFREVCARLGMTRVPALYVVQAGGALNAFAARHAGRDFVVVFSDFLDALGANSPEMKFILGHELGHIKSRHVSKQIFLAPGLFMPLLGPAYRRSWESSCDRYGAFGAADVDSAVRAMLTLTGGRECGRRLNAEAFASQHQEERGFFVSLHELVSTYPTLSRRVTDLIALKGSSLAPAPSRNPLAYFIALFMPGGQTAAPVSALIFILVIGMVAAMAIPAVMKVRQTSIYKNCLNNLHQLDSAKEVYVVDNNKSPAELSDLVGAGKYVATMPVCPAGGDYQLVVGDTPDKTHVICTVHGSEEELRQGSPGGGGR